MGFGFMYALTIFLGAFLVFQVQPLVGKCILPWFGGGPGVWTTCLLFFQVMLLVGYCYSHLVVLRLSAKAQSILHGVLLLATLALLPITPSEAWKTTELGNPTWRILALLAITVGGPYIVLSSTAPLIQAWFARRHVDRSPYRLYSLSNLGALLALLSYPILIEPQLTLLQQSWLWSRTYVVFVAACGICAWRSRFETLPQTLSQLADEFKSKPFDSPEVQTAKTTPWDIGLWLALAAMGTVILMATTNRMCQDVAAVPFLWILPLALYLISFIICFDHARWYHRNLWSVALLCSFVVMVLMFAKINFTLFGVEVNFGMQGHIYGQIAILAVAMFTCIMCCHGELAKLKPPASQLTLFYLMISTGGAIGGIFVALIAPMLFDSYAEFQLGFMIACMMILVAIRRSKAREKGQDSLFRWRRFAMVMTTVAVVMVVVKYVIIPLLITPDYILEAKRNFYGVLKVVRKDSRNGKFNHLIMSHGTTVHGGQYLNEPIRSEPTIYYARKSGIGLAITNHPKRIEGEKILRLGVIGLGVGTLAAYAEKGDNVKFYEINPDVQRLARKHFSYLSDAQNRGVNLEVLLGDARIVLQQQLAQGQHQGFDVLAIDAFSSDSIPVHLLTKECFELYRHHLAPGGFLAVHVTNSYLNLAPVVLAMAKDNNEQAVLIKYKPSKEDNKIMSGIRIVPGFC